MDKRTARWTRQQWEKAAVVDFQKMIRYEAAADNGGVLSCVSCDVKSYDWRNTDNKFDAGHLFSRRHANTKFVELNCWPQCVGCNRYRDGNYRDYVIRFLDIHGRWAYDNLEALSRETRKPWTVAELQVMRAEFRDRWKEAESKLKLLG